jgi:hypothetical protein
VSENPEPQLILEATQHRCQSACLEASIEPERQNRPKLVKVCLNKALRDAVALATGSVPPDSYVCVNPRCGALMNALKALAPLQEIVK